ncbi:MAG: flagellar biosynthesis protein FlhF [Armatimonadota bacterium]|nr:flagellar biosynthesis protein FlhF [Armatimonadota bacterium]MDW8103487.1 flagellar biosynthesis protein FlhF [Armatimonadota bacterium]MDW8289986.1 flagellar biosynthesis protein FlhF [Armatimonadota bacterium]
MAQIRRYQAKTITEALAMVRADLGRDAVIVQTRKVNQRILGVWKREMVEVWASDNPDLESLRRPPAPTTLTATPGASPEHSSRIEQLENEIRNLKAMIAQLAQQGVAVVPERAPREPAESPWMSLLRQAEVEEEVACALLQSVAQDSLSESTLQSLIAARLATSGGIALQEAQPKVVMLVGPTGVGKTTTIAKLAAQYALLQRRRVGLITIDTYRIAAVEQLRTYSQIIDVPIRVVYSSNEMPAALKDFSQMEIVFVDTAGRSQRNSMQIGELKACCERIRDCEVHLVLSATTKTRDLYDIVERFSAMPLHHVIWTKLDESTAFGNILNVAVRYPLPISYVTTGQRVPEDVEVAEANKLASLVVGGAGAFAPAATPAL